MVSIHAPVKGATRALIRFKLASLVSIHAPVKGATDTDQPGHDIDDVSIHAPVKGATVYLKTQFCVFVCFNPRTRKGCDSTGQHF